ncbi:MAG: cation:proton antiporter [Nanoarchaeota archaeon]
MYEQIITVIAISFFAMVAILLSSKFKQPLLLGFLLIGALIGPHMLNLVNDAKIINYLIEGGAVLLLFIIGLEFNLDKLKKVGMKSIFIGLFKVGIVFFMGYHIFTLFLSVKEAALLALIISFSSTIVIIKMLESKNMLARQEVPTLVAILIIEDLIAVAFLTLITGMGKAGGANILPILEKLFNSLFVIVLVYIVFLAVLRPLFRRIILKNNNDSVLIFASMFMICLLSWISYLLGLSLALGAFLAGSLISSIAGSKSESQGFIHAVNPYSFLFSSLFFIAIGTLVDVTKIWEYKYIILAIILVVIVTRLIAVGLLTYLFSSFRGEQTFFSSIIMISVGEFSLLIAREGMKLDVGIDLVTLTSVIIFLSAILMSFTLNYATSVQNTFSAHTRTAINTKIKMVASYVKGVFEELDLENTYTIRFKKQLNFIGGLFIAFFVFLNIFVRFMEIAAREVLYQIAYLMVALAVLGALGYILYTQSKKAYRTLTIILANQTFTRDVRRSKKILQSSIVSFFLIFLGLSFPLVIFLAGLSKPWGFVSVGLVVVGLVNFARNFIHINSSLKDNMFPKYTKLTQVNFKKYSTPKATMVMKKV